MSKLSKKTINGLRKIEKAILEEPKRLDMHQWGEKELVKGGLVKSGDVDKADAPPCGTVACMAGWAVTLLMPKKEFNKFMKPAIDMAKSRGFQVFYFPWDTEDRAAALLNLNGEQADALFLPDFWPPDYKSTYRLAKGTPKQRAKIRAKVTASYIEAFIKADGVINASISDIERLQGVKGIDNE